MNFPIPDDEKTMPGIPPMRPEAAVHKGFIARNRRKPASNTGKAGIHAVPGRIRRNDRGPDHKGRPFDIDIGAALNQHAMIRFLKDRLLQEREDKLKKMDLT